MAPISRTLSLGLIIAKASAFHAPAVAAKNVSIHPPATLSSRINTAVVGYNNNSVGNPTTTTRQPTARRMIGSILDLLSGGGGGGDSGGMIDPKQALRGRPEKMAGIRGLKHYVLKNDLEEVPPGYEVCVFGNGCFWGSEKAMWRLPRGIHSTAVGYCAGYTPNPTYNEACSSNTGHTEGVRVVYNPKEISYVDILRMFWESHDPTQYMGQGNDRGSQYRSGIYYFNDDQRRLI